MMKNDCNSLIILKGLVVPVNWDNQGNVTGIAIAGYNEMESVLLMDDVGIRLMALLHEKVVIEGRKVKIDNMDVIEVRRFDKDSI